MHADKEPEPLNLGVPVVNFPRANAILARAQALLWVRDWLSACSVSKSVIAIWRKYESPSSPGAINIHVIIKGLHEVVHRDEQVAQQSRSQSMPVRGLGSATT